MYQVIQITELTDKHITVLLSDDVVYDVDRGAFEEYVAEHGEYVMNGGKIPLHIYWENLKVNDKPHLFDLNDYLSHSKSEQLEIDVVRAWANIGENIPMFELAKIRAYGIAQFNLGQYKNL